METAAFVYITIDQMNANSLVEQKARFATLEAIREKLIPNHIDPSPCTATLRRWFDRESIPRMKCNPGARRGGGPVYYRVADVEKLLRSSMMPRNGGAR